MKLSKLFFAVVLTSATMSSCVMYKSHTTTGNPVGTKVGTVTSKPFKNTNDVGIAAAAKQGGITKIATVDFKVTSYIIFSKTSTTVTGE